MPVFTAGAEHAGKRIDVVLKTLEPSLSRAALQRAVKEGRVLLGGRPVSPSYRMRAGDEVRYDAPCPFEEPAAERIELAILHEDDWILVIDKPPGMTVHPVRAGQRGTLVGALLGYTDVLSDVGGPLRRGIVHRLDRDTSGVTVAARTNAAHEAISTGFRKREIRKEYLAIVEGVLDLDGDRVRMDVARDARHPRKMSESAGGREACTDYEVIERFARHTLARARPRTGRTHQIRLAFSRMGHPVACDSVYGAKKTVTEEDLADDPSEPDRVILRRQALHAHRLEFIHPGTGRSVSFEAPLPADMTEAVRIAGKM